jgi:hypothetical protein
MSFSRFAERKEMKVEEAMTAFCEFGISRVSPISSSVLTEVFSSF